MKRICALLLTVLLGFLTCSAYAQGKVFFKEEGRSAGAVNAVELNGITYVDVQRTARKLGAQVEMFAASKQAKITAKGFYAILTASLDEIIVNGKPRPIKGEITAQGSQLMAPVEVFLLPSFQLAVDKQITFENNTFIVERRFNVELANTVLNEQENLLLFDTHKAVAFETSQPNAHTVLVTLKDVILKRDFHQRLHTPYISSVSLRQARNNAEMKVILGASGKAWSFTPQGNRLVFRVAARDGSPQLPPVPATAVKAEPNPLAISAVDPLTPSVLEEDEFEEMPLEGESAPAVQTPAAAEDSAPAGTVPVVPAVVTPVIKAEPHPLAVTANHKKMRIVVDPGHGGKDPGATRSKYREKDWNLAVGKELAQLLKKGNFEVKITRDTDTFIALSDRSKMANNFKADLFVSIHVNATKNTQANGFQVYFRSEKATDKEAAATAALENEATQYEEVHYNFVDALLQSMAKNEYINESSKLAGYVKNAVHKQPGIGIAVDQKNCIRQANFYVLKGVQSPAILVEMGFISSTKDRAKLSQASVQKKMAQGIYNGIVNYAKQEGWIN